MQLDHLWLTDFRNYDAVDIALPEGLCAVVGQNGHGKTNLIEAIAHIAGTPLRGATTETMVHVGAERAVVRGQGRRGSRDVLVEAELAVRGRGRIQLNRQPVRRRRDLLEAFVVTVFSPEDLVLVKGGPSQRREWIDGAVVGLDPRADDIRVDVERILKQRNSLLKSVRGRRLDEAAALTLDVWDDRLVRAGEQLAQRRRDALDVLVPAVAVAYHDLAGRDLPVTGDYVAPWMSGGLAEALVAARDDDLRRGVSTVGPHRDEIDLRLDGLPARTHASQGEQRSLALAMRLAVHRAVADAIGSSPILLLDDVFSELDEARSERLLAHLPGGQTLLTTAGALPTETTPELILEVRDGVIASAG